MSVIRKKRKLCSDEVTLFPPVLVKQSMKQTFPIQELHQYLQQNLPHLETIVVHTNDGDLDMLRLFLPDYRVEMYNNQTDPNTIGFFFKEFDEDVPHSYMIVAHPSRQTLDTYRNLKPVYCTMDQFQLDYLVLCLLQK